MIDLSIKTVYSNLLKAKGSVWHKTDMKKGMVPYHGIYTDASWRYSHTNGWVFRYKPHLISSTASDFIVSLTVDVTTANVQNSKI